MRTLAERVATLVARVPGSLKVFEETHGIANGTLQKLAKGLTTQPSPKTLQKMSVAFGVPVSWIVGETADAEPPPERKMELDDRYPTRREAIALLTGIVPEAVLKSVAMQALDARSDPGLDHWITEIKRLARVRADVAKEVEISPEETAPGRRAGR